MRRRGFTLVELLLALSLLSILMVAVAVASLSAQRRPAANEPASVTATLAAQPADQGYTGEDTCRSCHRSELTQFHKTEHAGVKSADGTQQMNCETCHGPGKAHADAQQASRGDDALSAAANRLIFSFKGTSAENSARCLSCHNSTARLQKFDHSGHAATGVSCQTCHATHLTEAADDSAPNRPPLAQAQFSQVPRLAAEQRWLRESLLKDTQPTLCFQCHQQVRTQFALPNHHRVPEGSMKCTDCHSPHGTPNRPSLTAAGWETCTNCHADKHGPFVFEHGGVQVEGCAVCHTPHGSVSRFMLQRRESRFLCLQCHGVTAAGGAEQPGVPHSRLGFQTRGDCTRCHVTIHGSNLSKVFLQ